MVMQHARCITVSWKEGLVLVRRWLAGRRNGEKDRHSELQPHLEVAIRTEVDVKI